MFLPVKFVLLDLEIVALVRRQPAATQSHKDMKRQRNMIPIKKNNNSATHGIHTLPKKEFQIVLLRKLGKI